MYVCRFYYGYAPAWVWAVTMCQLNTLYSTTLSPIQKPTMRPSLPLSNAMLNIGNDQGKTLTKEIYCSKL